MYARELVNVGAREINNSLMEEVILNHYSYEVVVYLYHLVTPKSLTLHKCPK